MSSSLKHADNTCPCVVHALQLVIVFLILSTAPFIRAQIFTPQTNRPARVKKETAVKHPSAVVKRSPAAQPATSPAPRRAGTQPQIAGTGNVKSVPAAAHVELDPTESALREFNAALLRNSNNLTAYRGRAALFLGQQNYDAALADLATAVNLAPETDKMELTAELGHAFLARGDNSMQHNDLIKAKSDYTSAAELANANPVDVARAYTKRASVQFKLDQPQAALNDLDTALNLDPTNHEARLQRGIVRESSGQFADAITDLNMALREAGAGSDEARTKAASTALMRSYHKRSLQLVEKKLDQLALADHKQALQLSPESAAVFSSELAQEFIVRGEASVNNGDDAGAAQALALALELTPDRSAAFKDRIAAAYVARAGQKSGTADLDQAIALNTRALEIAPQNAEALAQAELLRQRRLEHTAAPALKAEPDEATVAATQSSAPGAQPTGPPMTMRHIVTGGVLNGAAVRLVRPIYPPVARANAVSGVVRVQVLIDEAGSVVSASAIDGHKYLQDAAVNAARDAKFRPTLLSGSPVQVTGYIVFEFLLPEPPR